LDIYDRVRTFAGRSLSDCPFRYQGQYEDKETGLSIPLPVFQIGMTRKKGMRTLLSTLKMIKQAHLMIMII
jgi:hypothetical protein